MKAVLVNYNFDPEWLLDYPELEVTLYDRSDDGVSRDLTKYGQVLKTKNLGDVDYDKLGWLVQNYDNLPDVFLWGKSNLFKFVEKEYFDEMLSKRQFAPLLKFNHRTYSDKFGDVCYYSGNMYWERADNWFFHTTGVDTNHIKSWQEWCSMFGIPQLGFNPFPPGGNFFLTRDAIHKYSRDLYAAMRDTMPYAQRPVEAQCAERSYYLLWK